MLLQFMRLPRRRQINMARASADLRSPGLASFGPDVGPLPRASLSADVSLPRQLSSRSYMGLATWNSRGASLQIALRALLGDATAHVESVAFTARRLQLRLGAGVRFDAALRELVYPSTYSNWGGHGRFWTTWLKRINATAEALKAEKKVSQSGNANAAAALRRARELARSDEDAPRAEAAAAALAAVLVDRLFADEGWRREVLTELAHNTNVAAEQSQDFQVLWSCVQRGYRTLNANTREPQAVDTQAAPQAGQRLYRCMSAKRMSPTASHRNTYPWVTASNYGTSLLVFETDTRGCPHRPPPREPTPDVRIALRPEPQAGGGPELRQGSAGGAGQRPGAACSGPGRGGGRGDHAV